MRDGKKEFEAYFYSKGWEESKDKTLNNGKVTK